MRPHDPPPSTRAWAGRPRHDLADIPVLLWRERWLMLGVFLAVFALGLAAAFTLKTTYTATSSVLVRLGQEYVYEPRAGDAGRGAAPDSDTLIQAETEILGSPEVKRRTIERLGLSQIDEDLARAYAAAGAAEKRAVIAKAVDGMAKSLTIETAPNTPIIRAAYEHRDPAAAARILNTLLEEYLVYRQALLLGGDAPALDAQRQAFEDRLAEADRAYEAFLQNNRIGDFSAEKASLTQMQAQIEQQKFAAEAQLQDRRGRLAVLERQLAEVTPEVGLYRDVTNAGAEKLAQLKVQREDLLSRYRPDSKPVQDLNAQIAQLEAGVANGRTEGAGARRVGINPVHQTLQTERIQLAAEVAALEQSRQAMEGQIALLTERRLRLAELEPEFQDLALSREVLQAQVRDFSVKAEQSRAAREIASGATDNIRIVQRASEPTEGSSLKTPVAVLALLFAGFSALCAGLLRMLTRPGLPTPRSAARTLDLPVLGAAPLKAY